MTDSESKEKSDEDEDTRCEYVFTPEDSRGDLQTGLTEEWNCPHPAVDKSDNEHLCIFHLPIEEKEGRDVLKRFIECISMQGGAAKRFVGAKIPSLSLVNRSIRSRDNNPIDLRHSTIYGNVSLDGASISQAIFLTEAEIRGSISAGGTQFFEPLFAQHTTIDEGGRFNKVEFHNVVNFRNSTFCDETAFRNCIFHDEASFYGCEFNIDPSDPSGVLTEAYHRKQFIDFTNSTFEDGVNFNSSIFNDTFFFKGITSNGVVHLNSIELNERFYTHEFTKPEWDLSSEEEAHGHHVAEISGEFDSLRLSIENLAEEPCIISLENAEINAGQLAQPEEQSVYYDLTSASLGTVELKNMNSAEAWRYLIFKNTDFNGFDFTDYRSALEELGFDIFAIQKPTQYDWFSEQDLQDIETTYVKAGIGASAVKDSRAASEFHIHELNTRRLRLRKERKCVPYLAHLIYGETSQYGEKPSRVLFVFVPVLLASYWFTNVQPISSEISMVLGFLLIVLPPIFSALLVLSSSRYIGN